MKTKTLLLLVAIFTSGLVFSQSTLPVNETNCEKKVLKKIKRKINYIHLNDYLTEGENARMIVSCIINDDYEVEVAAIKGYDEELKKAIIETLKDHPVKCEDQTKGSSFTFALNLKIMPA